MNKLSFENYLLSENKNDSKEILFKRLFNGYMYDLLNFAGYYPDKNYAKETLINDIYDSIEFAKANGANISYVNGMGYINPLDGRYIDLIIKKSINKKTRKLNNVSMTIKQIKTGSTNKIKDPFKYEIGVFFIELDKYWAKIVRNIDKEDNELRKITNIADSVQKVTEIYCRIISKKHFKTAADKSTIARKDIIKKCKKLWEKNGCIRNEKEAERLEIELRKENIYRDSGTIYGWMSEWRKK